MPNIDMGYKQAQKSLMPDLHPLRDTNVEDGLPRHEASWSGVTSNLHHLYED